MVILKPAWYPFDALGFEFESSSLVNNVFL